MSIDEILMLLMVEDWFADDLHYNSCGKSFYEKHLLADRIRDFGSAMDDLKECYYLGFLNSTPPPTATYAAGAVKTYDDINNSINSVLEKLKVVLSKICEVIEGLKNENKNLPSGVVAILDGISQKALTYKFLVSSESAE